MTYRQMLTLLLNLLLDRFFLNYGSFTYMQVVCSVPRTDGVKLLALVVW